MTRERVTITAKELQPGDRIFRDPAPEGEIPTTKQLRTDLVTGVGLNLCCGTVDVSIYRGTFHGTVDDIPMDMELDITRSDEPHQCTDAAEYN